MKDYETRVGLTPAGVYALRKAGHEVLVEEGAGIGGSMSGAEYVEAGAVVLDSAADVWAQADIVVNVKEPPPSEVAYFRPNLILFTYLHLVPLPELTRQLKKAQVTAIAYET